MEFGGVQVETMLLDESAAKKAAQAELDDLLMVFGDLEEKVARYKASFSAPRSELG